MTGLLAQLRKNPPSEAELDQIIADISKDRAELQEEFIVRLTEGWGSPLIAKSDLLRLLLNIYAADAVLDVLKGGLELASRGTGPELEAV